MNNVVGPDGPLARRWIIVQHQESIQCAHLFSLNTSNKLNRIMLRIICFDPIEMRTFVFIAKSSPLIIHICPYAEFDQRKHYSIFRNFYSFKPYSSPRQFYLVFNDHLDLAYSIMHNNSDRKVFYFINRTKINRISLSFYINYIIA